MNLSKPVRLLPPLGLMLVNFVLSSIPGPEPDQVNLLTFVPPSLQNLLHVPFYGLLCWLWYRALVTRSSPGRALAAAILLSLAWGVLDELHQHYVPGRFASLTDIGFNSAGVLLAAAMVNRLSSH